MRQIEEAIELADSAPDVKVQPAEYTRLLGYPRGWVLEGRAEELAEETRNWYAKHGRPWRYARQAENLEVAGDSVRIDGVPFSSKSLRSTLLQAEAHSVILVAVGAGPEAEEEARRRWMDEKPDEYFFLEMFASAVVEHLTTMTGANLCDWAERHEMAVLPHHSPGYPGWDVAEQPRLLDLLERTRRQTLPSRVDVFDSGMLRPKKTQLAVFGVTRHIDHLRRLTELIPCENCSFGPCQYRRAPYRRGAGANGASRVDALDVEVLDRDAEYSVNTKALRRWAGERLSLHAREDGTIEAQFRYDGTTCTNMGRPLTFLYDVELGPRAEGYPIREQRCSPAPGDSGHTQMCEYLQNADALTKAIHGERPLSGQRLNAVLAWRRTACAAGCYCDPSSRDHKWGLVLETIHYALVQKEKA